MALFQQSATALAGTLINELSKLYAYSVTATQAKVERLSEGDMFKETWDNTLKEYGDILTVTDLCAIFRKSRQTINRWRKEGRITPIDNSVRPQYRKDEVKKNYLKLHQAL